MKTTSFGATDLEVTNLCLGTMQFGWTADEAASVSVLDGYVEAGGNFIDTADIYSRWSPGRNATPYNDRGPASPTQPSVYGT